MFKYLADVTFNNHDGYNWEKHLKFLKKNPEIKYVFVIDEKFGPYDKVRDCGFAVFGNLNVEDYIKEDM